MRYPLHGLLTGVLLALAAAAAASANPRADYLMHCAGCHLADASGVPPCVPSLADPLRLRNELWPEAAAAPAVTAH